MWVSILVADGAGMRSPPGLWLGKARDPAFRDALPPQATIKKPADEQPEAWDENDMGMALPCPLYRTAYESAGERPSPAVGRHMDGQYAEDKREQEALECLCPGTSSAPNGRCCTRLSGCCRAPRVASVSESEPDPRSRSANRWNQGRGYGFFVLVRVPGPRSPTVPLLLHPVVLGLGSRSYVVRGPGQYIPDRYCM